MEIGDFDWPFFAKFLTEDLQCTAKTNWAKNYYYKNCTWLVFSYICQCFHHDLQV